MLEFEPTGGEPAGQVLYSQADDRTLGVAELDPVPDSFSAGAERTTCERRPSVSTRIGSRTAEFTHVITSTLE